MSEEREKALRRLAYLRDIPADETIEGKPSNCEFELVQGLIAFSPLIPDRIYEEDGHLSVEVKLLDGSVVGFSTYRINIKESGDE